MSSATNSLDKPHNGPKDASARRQPFHPHGKRHRGPGRGGPSRKRRKPHSVKDVVAKETWTCSICHAVDTPNRYRCPKCWANYCSIACCRVHKQADPPCVKKETKLPSNTSASMYVPAIPVARPSGGRRRPDENPYEDLEEGWKMTPDMIQRMHRSGWLRGELRDPGLRSLVQQIATASNVVPTVVGQHRQATEQERLLQQFKTDFPRFRKFIDKLLVMTGVLERHGDDAPLDEWLRQEHSLEDHEERQHLVLQALPLRRVSKKIQRPAPNSSSSESSRDEDSSSSDNTNDD